MLSIKNLEAGYGKVKVLHGISMEVPKAKVVTLIGSNGAGKTTTMRAVSGMIKPTSGEITLGDKRIDGLDSHRIAKLGLAHSPEGRRVFATMSVTDNLRLGAFPRLTGSRPRGDVAADLERAMDLFPRLKERIKQAGNTLSGGEQQMLAIARCLMMRPKLIILDEPTEGIMPLLVSQIRREIYRINQSGVSILLVEQNVETALKLCPRVFLMEKGTVVYSGTSHELKSQTSIVHRYLGLSR